MSEVSTTTSLLGETCPKCGNDEAWHGVVTEPGERERFACDECGMWLALTVNKVEPPRPPKAKRPFGFSVEIQAGQLFVDVRGESVLSFKWGHGWYVGTNHFTINSNAEEDRLEQMWTEVGREGERLRAERAGAAS